MNDNKRCYRAGHNMFVSAFSATTTTANPPTATSRQHQHCHPHRPAPSSYCLAPLAAHQRHFGPKQHQPRHGCASFTSTSHQTVSATRKRKKRHRKTLDRQEQHEGIESGTITARRQHQPWQWWHWLQTIIGQIFRGQKRSVRAAPAATTSAVGEANRWFLVRGKLATFVHQHF